MKRFYLLILIFSLPILLCGQNIVLPNQINGLELWLIGDSVDANASSVDTCFDISGNGNHAIQSNSNEMPSISSQLLNNFDCLYFDGFDDCLNFNSINDIRTVFWVIKEDLGATPNFRSLLGHSGSYDFMRNESNLNIWGTYTSSSIKNGKTWLNSSMVDGEVTPVPSDFSIISVITTSNVQASNFSRDRSIVSRSWQGHLAELIVFSDSLNEVERTTVEHYLRHKYFPSQYVNPVNLAANITVPYGFCDTTIQADINFIQYLWNTGETTESIQVQRTGYYSVTATDAFGFQSSDSIYVQFPHPNVLNDSTICEGSTLSWAHGLPSTLYSCAWSTGANDSSLAISQIGAFAFQLTDTSGCTYASDTAHIGIDFYPSTTNLGADLSLCAGQSIGLETGADQTEQYLWNTGATSSEIVISASGTYHVTCTNTAGCVAIDSIDIVVQGLAPVFDFSVSGQCQGDSTYFNEVSSTLDGSQITEWLWDFGDGQTSSLQHPVHQYADTGQYVVSLWVKTNQDCENIINKVVGIYSLPIVSFSISSPIRGLTVDLLNNSTTSMGIIDSVSWVLPDGQQTSDYNSEWVFQDLGFYSISLMVGNSFDCYATEDSTIEVLPLPIDLINNLDKTHLSLWIMADSLTVGIANSVDTCFDNSFNGNHAVQSLINERPTVISNMLNGHNCLYFDGIDDCLNFNDLNYIRTVFWVIKEDDLATNNYRSLFGHHTSYDFLSDNNKIWSSYTNSNITNGFTFLNSQIMDGLLTPMPKQFSIISLQTTDFVSASNFMRDRTFPDRSWQGHLAEILVFSDSLNQIERTTVENYLRYKYFPDQYVKPVYLGTDVDISNGFCPTTLDAGARFTAFQWSSGETSQTISVNHTGYYSVTATDIFGFQSSDSVYIHYPEPYQLNDSLFCSGDTIRWGHGLPASLYTCTWSNGANDSSLAITQAADYFFLLTDTANCVYQSDTAHISVDVYPETTNLGPEDTLCSGQNIGLQTGASETINYLWNTGVTTPLIQILTPGIYHLTATNAYGCMAIDSIQIAIQGLAPVPDISFMAQCQGDSTRFTDLSSTLDGSQITEWLWDFGDGQSSNLQHPVHLYADTGQYHVQLWIKNNQACENQTEKMVAIYSKPVADFTTSGLCEGYEVSLSNTSHTDMGYIDQILWTFPDGSQSTALSPVWTFDTAGLVPIKLWVRNQWACSDSIAPMLEVKNSPVAAFTHSPMCATKQAYFYDISSTEGVNSIVSRQWIGQMGQSGTESIFSPSMPNSGDYTLQLIVRSLNGCTDTLIESLWVYDSPFANFSFDTICWGHEFVLYNQSADQQSLLSDFFWYFDSVLVSREYEAHLLAEDTGLHKVGLRVISQSGCSDQIELNVPITALPIATFDVSESYSTPEKPIRFTADVDDPTCIYRFDFGDQSTSTQQDIWHAYATNGGYNSKLRVTNLLGCSDSSVIEIRIVQPLLDLSISDLQVFESDGFVKIQFLMANLGNLEIPGFSMAIDWNQQSGFAEDISDTLSLGEFQTYTLKSKLPITIDRLDYVCLTAKVNGTYPDIDLINNQVCTVNSAQNRIIKLYPTPAQQFLHMQYQSDQHQISIYTIYSHTGQIVASGEIELKQGISDYRFDIESLRPGVYLLEIDNQKAKFSVEQ